MGRPILAPRPSLLPQPLLQLLHIRPLARQLSPPSRPPTQVTSQFTRRRSTVPSRPSPRLLSALLLQLAAVLHPSQPPQLRQACQLLQSPQASQMAVLTPQLLPQLHQAAAMAATPQASQLPPPPRSTAQSLPPPTLPPRTAWPVLLSSLLLLC